MMGGAVALLLGERPTSSFSLQSLAAFGYLTVIGSMVAYTAYGFLLRHVRPALATSYAYVNPLVAVCLGVALAGDRVTPLGIVGMVVILVGVVLVSLARGRAASAEPAHSVTSAAPGDSSPSASQAESGQ
jgi:drug/metabolite transporter (DMT)-like permease